MKCVYMSCRHVIMVDSTNVISWVGKDLRDRGGDTLKIWNLEQN